MRGIGITKGIRAKPTVFRGLSSGDVEPARAGEVCALPTPSYKRVFSPVTKKGRRRRGARDEKIAES